MSSAGTRTRQFEDNKKMLLQCAVPYVPRRGELDGQDLSNLTFHPEGEPRTNILIPKEIIEAAKAPGEVRPAESGSEANPPIDLVPLSHPGGIDVGAIRRDIYSELERGKPRMTKIGVIPGAVHIAVGNIITILKKDPYYRGRIRLNTMDQCVYLGDEVMPESFATHVQVLILKEYGLNFRQPEMVRSAIRVVAEGKTFNPLQNYLDSLKWDGLDRTIPLLKILKIPSTELNINYFRMWLLGCIHRAEEPGAKMDYILVLYGPEGVAKSTFFEYISLGSPFFSDSALDLSTKDGLMALQKRWIYEVPEIDWILTHGLTGKVKAAITSRVDSFRAPFAKEVTEHPRTCVMGGTTNIKHLLKDHGGDRRFWVVEVGSDMKRQEVVDFLLANRDQIWAQMKDLYEQGVLPVLPDHLEAERRASNQNFQTPNYHEDLFLAHARRLAELFQNSDDLKRGGFTIDQLFTEVDWDAKRISIKSPKDVQKMAEVFKNNGMVNRKVGRRGVMRWFFTDEAMKEILATDQAEFKAIGTPPVTFPGPFPVLPPLPMPERP